MKSLYILCLILTSNLCYATQNQVKDIVCDSGQTVIKRGRPYGWGGIESFFKSSDPDILHFLKQSISFKGQILEERFTNGKIEGEFIYIERNWQKLTPEKSITIKEITSGQDGPRTLELNISQRPWFGCVKEEVISGCYAGDDCVTRCVQEVAIPEVIYFSKKITCVEK
jgi:hypothetical protein